MPSLLEYLQTHDEAFRSRARLASLYSDFTSQRLTNPDGYAANSAAWLRALSSASKEGLLPGQTGSAQHDHFTLHTGEELARALQTPEFGRPLALSSVVQDAVRKKQLVPLKQFLESKQSLYARSWVPSAWDVVSWGLRQIGLLNDSGGETSDKFVAGDFVLVSNLETAAKQTLDLVADTCTTPSSRIFSTELFAQHLQSRLGTPISTTDLRVLLTHLSRDRQACAIDPASRVLKFSAPNTTTTAIPEAITHEDKTTASLRTLIATLTTQTTALNTRVTDLNSQTRAAVKANNLPAARTTLKQKKAAETTLAARSATLLQLEEVYMKLEQAADQVEVVRVMEAAGSTLRSLNEKTGGVERVQDVVEEMREQMRITEEIGSAVNEVSAGEVDEGEVDEELEALERGEREKREAGEKAERERREAEEARVKAEGEEAGAEEVRKRLGELEGVGQKRKAEEVEQEGTASEKRVQDSVAAD